MTKPEISNDFTMEDIRTVRDRNSERHSNMTSAEILKDISDGAAKGLERMKALKEQKRAV